MTFLLSRGWVGTLPDTGGDSFTIPTTPATSTASKVPLNPNFTAGPTGKEPYRLRSHAVLEGLAYYANGYDQPWSFNPAVPSAAYSLGAAAPTTFVVADDTGGTSFPAGTVLRYKLVFGNSTTGKKTCPQTSTVDGETVTFVQHTMAGTKDAKVTWTDPGGEFNKAYIYRALQDSDTFHLVATVTAATATYTDSTSDTTLRGNDIIVERYRLTLPPIFDGLASHLNRLWGWEPDGSIVYFSQAARADGERVQEDFPDANFLPVGPEDGLGPIRAILPHYDSAFVFKRRGCYEVSGYSAGTFQMRRVFSDRGGMNHRCVAARDGIVFILDERGLYFWTPGSEPIVAAAPAGSDYSPMQPIWDRMNLSAWSTFSVTVIPSQQIVVCKVALDYEPIPNVRIVFDYARNRFVSVDTLVWGGLSGVLEDAQGVTHDVSGDDFGYLWEDAYAQSEGVYSGDNTGAVTGSTGMAINASAAAFATSITGPKGAPMERYSSAGVVLDQNRVYTGTSTSITPYYYSTEAVAAGQSVAVGVIPAVITLPQLTMDRPEMVKSYNRIALTHGSGVSGSLKVETAVNEDGFSNVLPEPSLSSRVQSIAAPRNFGFTWTLQISQRYANLGFSIRSVTLWWSEYRERSL